MAETPQIDATTLLASEQVSEPLADGLSLELGLGLAGSALALAALARSCFKSKKITTKAGDEFKRINQI